MLIVEVSQIPKVEEIIDVPLDDLVAVYKVCQEMREVCEKENGIGLSAVQVGIPWKLFLVKGDGTCPLVPEGEYGYFANTEYEATSEQQVVSLEGCLSIRSEDGQLRSFQVNRHEKINIKGLYLNNIENNFICFEQELDVSEEGVVFAHEIDHQRGTLISEIGKEVFMW
jgi:peptide deformylase